MTLLALAAVVALVVLIFIYQAICGKHAEIEYQKRAMVYRKEDANIRNTIKQRKMTGTGSGARGTIQSKASYSGLPAQDVEPKRSHRAVADEEVPEVDSAREVDAEPEQPGNQASALAGAVSARS